MEKVIFNLRKLLRHHTAVAVFLLCLLLFLSVRASDEYRWSDWGFGDAQTLLSLRQWEEGGWISNYFLFIPQGYAKAVRLFDSPELRQHAHGTCPGSSPRIGPRLWYTHYPAGYLVPYAVLFKLGLDSMFSVRMLSVIFSITALVLMYIVFSKITTKGVSFVAVLFYGLSPVFLGYADSLANQPIDDLLRFAFMLAVVFATRADSLKQRRIWMFSAWVFEFFLSLSSFDSVFFVYLWLIGWDVLEKRGFRWKTYLVYAIAPVTAHSLQFLQNVWYLGLNDAVIDIKDAFLLKNAADPSYNLGQNRFNVIHDTITILFDNLYSPGGLIAVLFGFYVLYYLFIKGRNYQGLPTIKLLSLLFICGLSFIIVLPHAARMPYEARQMIPFAALLAGGVTWSFLKEFKYSIHGNPGNSDEKESRVRKNLKLPFLLLASILILVFWYDFVLNDRQPLYLVPDAETDARFASEIESMQKYDLIRFRQIRTEVLFAEELKKLPTAFEPVFFSIGGFQLFWDPKYVPGYPQIMPITEYYTGSKPVLCFNAPEGLANDLIYMVRKSPYKFSPVLISSDPVYIDQVLFVLLKEGILKVAPPRTYSIMNKYVLDLTNYLDWGNKP